MIPGARTKVPCNGCTLCCRNELLIVHPEMGDDPRRYLTQSVTHPLTGKPALALRQKPNGDCIYLGEDGCSIHGDAPVVCRSFDCRDLAARFMRRPRQERRRALREHLVDRDLIERGLSLDDTEVSA